MVFWRETVRGVKKEGAFESVERDPSRGIYVETRVGH
jgi:hypothetical protein